MALDGIYTHYLIKELNQSVENTRVESVWLNGLMFVFSLYAQKQRHHLVINLNASFTSTYLTTQPPSKKDTSNFLNQLKKYLEGGILKNITQYQSDRVIEFSFTVYDFIYGPVERKLIFEAMGRHANLYLIEQGKIIDLYKRMFVLEGRHLIPNATFGYFLSDKLDAKDYVFDPLATPKDITNKYLGISLRLANYLQLTGKHPFEIEVQPTLSIDDNKSYFFNLFGSNTKSFNTLSEALDSRVMLQKDEKSVYRSFISNQLKKLEKKHIQLTKQLDQAHQMLEDKAKGDLIYASGHNLRDKLPFIEDIVLDDQISLTSNAQKFYNNYQKGKRAIDFLEPELHKVLSEIEIFENYLVELELTDNETLSDFKEILDPYGFMKQKNKKNKPTRHKVKVLTLKVDDTTYFIGKNAHQNAHLVNQIGLSNDYWFHVKDAPGSHILVRTPELSEKVLRTSAMLAAYFSSQNASSSIPVNYTLFRYVSKIGGKPASFVKIKNEKTIYIDIDQTIVDNLLQNA